MILTLRVSHAGSSPIDAGGAQRRSTGKPGRFGDAISAEVNRGRALGYYVERRESGAVGAFQAKTREEADKQLEETIARIAAKQAIEKAKQGQS